MRSALTKHASRTSLSRDQLFDSPSGGGEVSALDEHGRKYDAQQVIQIIQRLALGRYLAPNLLSGEQEPEECLTLQKPSRQIALAFKSLRRLMNGPFPPR